MLTKALEVLDSEMREAGTMSYKKIHSDIEPLLYSANDEILTEIAEKKKTIGGAIRKMEEIVKAQIKKKSGAVTCLLTDEEGLKICRDYFGLSGAASEKKETLSIFDL